MTQRQSSPILELLTRARWAPSGDNTQPWRFKIISDTAVDILLIPDHESVLAVSSLTYLHALGALIETARIAASAVQCRLTIMAVPNIDNTKTLKTIRLTMISDPTVITDPLHTVIEARSVARGLYTRKNLTPSDRIALRHAVSENFELRFLEGREKRRLWRIHWINNKIRLSWKGIFENYKKTIMWDQHRSVQYLPSHALGISKVTQFLFKRLLQNFALFSFTQRYLGGIFLSFLEVDLLPNIFCGANILLFSKTVPRTDDDVITCGATTQRFWLTATARGILHQPNYLPIAMNIYAKKGIPDTPEIQALAIAQRTELARIVGGDNVVDRLVWTGRIGYGTPGTSRSLRLPLEELIVK